MIGPSERRGAIAGAAALVVMAAMATAASSGCAKREAQRAVQTSLTGLAHGVNAADALVADAWPSAARRARAQVLVERNEAPAMTVGEGMARYEDLLVAWNNTLRAMRGARRALYLGQSAFDTWLASGELPEQWITFCASVGETVEHLIGLLGEVGLEVPLQLRSAGEFARRACEVAAPWVVVSSLSVAGAEGDQ